MTPWERKLWYEFLREYPVRFQRQKAIGNYIVDFYCAKAKLVIELDGSQHYNKSDMIKDKIRTEKLEEFNLTVIRIPNNAVSENFDGVCEYIDNFVKNFLQIADFGLRLPLMREVDFAKQKTEGENRERLRISGFAQNPSLLQSPCASFLVRGSLNMKPQCRFA